MSQNDAMNWEFVNGMPVIQLYHLITMSECTPRVASLVLPRAEFFCEHASPDSEDKLLAVDLVRMCRAVLA
jgi:hypothetical protein